MSFDPALNDVMLGGPFVLRGPDVSRSAQRRSEELAMGRVNARPDFAAYCNQVRVGSVPPDVGGQPRLLPQNNQRIRVLGMGEPETIRVVDLSLDDLLDLHLALKALDGRPEDYGALLATDVGMPFTQG